MNLSSRKTGSISVVFGIGNLLLDSVAKVPLQFLQKYELIPDSTQLAEDKHLSLYEELEEKGGVLFEVSHVPGGCALNAMRIAQWILRTPKSTVFVGAIGNDKESSRLTELLEREGIILECQKIENVATGRCAVLVNEATRTLVTQLGASLEFDFETFQSQNSIRFLEQANVVYISGYFLRVSSETAVRVGQRAKALKIPIVLNLNSVWVTQTCKNQLMEIMEYVDYLIGNESEIRSFSKTCYEFSFDDILDGSKKLHDLLNRSLVIIVTRGTGPVVCVINGEIQTFEIIHVPPEKIIDTNGAGDAFAGGFLAALAKGLPLEESVQCGLWAASEVVQQVGCNFPKDKFYSFDKVSS